jgi:hypothetical protein
MDNNLLEIRFHFGGKFHNFSGYVTYLGGGVAESEIEVDKLSYFEIKGHLQDHYPTDAILRLFWLMPGKELEMKDGLVLLVDDQSCQVMLEYHSHGGVQHSMVDLYVEEVGVQLTADDQDIWEGADDGDDEQAAPSAANVAISSSSERSRFEDKDYRSYHAFYKSPSKPTKDNAEDEEDNSWAGNDVEDKGKRVCSESNESSEDESDEDYLQPPSEDSSAEDEEAKQMRNYAFEIKKKIKAKKLGIHSAELNEFRIEDLVDEVPNLDEPDSPYMNSSDEYSYEENSDGETVRWKSLENRYDSKASVPVFSLGMCFRDSRQFKKALLKYGVKTHRHLRFDKDEAKKVRAFCTWPGCQWMIYGSLTTRSEWFKVVTFEDVHTCAPRRDNKLVTSRLIAKHYYHEIKDNPTWKPVNIQNRVQRDFIADVSISKCKRAKQLVLQEAVDAMRGEYSRVYDYQMELLRTNPGSTVVVCLDPEIEDRKVFERFYVCFDARKKGFLAGCRKVIRLDGCWFKGANC